MEYEWYIEYGGMVPKGENQEKELRGGPAQGSRPISIMSIKKFLPP